MARFVVVQTDVHSEADATHAVESYSGESTCSVCGLAIVKIEGSVMGYVHGFEPVDEFEFVV